MIQPREASATAALQAIARSWSSSVSVRVDGCDTFIVQGRACYATRSEFAELVLTLTPCVRDGGTQEILWGDAAIEPIRDASR
jgi:hypothetical protein